MTKMCQIPLQTFFLINSDEFQLSFSANPTTNRDLGFRENDINFEKTYKP